MQRPNKLIKCSVLVWEDWTIKPLYEQNWWKFTILGILYAETKNKQKIRTFKFEKRRYLPYCCLDNIKKYRCASGMPYFYIRHAILLYQACHTFKSGMPYFYIRHAILLYVDSLKITSTVYLRSAIREMYFSQTSLRVYFINR